MNLEIAKDVINYFYKKDTKVIEKATDIILPEIWEEIKKLIEENGENEMKGIDRFEIFDDYETNINFLVFMYKLRGSQYRYDLYPIFSSAKESIIIKVNSDICTNPIGLKMKVDSLGKWKGNKEIFKNIKNTYFKTKKIILCDDCIDVLNELTKLMIMYNLYDECIVESIEKICDVQYKLEKLDHNAKIRDLENNSTQNM